MKKVLFSLILTCFIGFTSYAEGNGSNPNQGSGVVVSVNPSEGVVVIIDSKTGEVVQAKGRPNLIINIGDTAVYIYRNPPGTVILKDIK